MRPERKGTHFVQFFWGSRWHRGPAKLHLKSIVVDNYTIPVVILMPIKIHKYMVDSLRTINATQVDEGRIFGNSL